jgi:hypothetical protein
MRANRLKTEKAQVKYGILFSSGTGSSTGGCPRRKGLSVEEAVSVFERQAGAKQAAA